MTTADQTLHLTTRPATGGEGAALRARPSVPAARTIEAPLVLRPLRLLLTTGATLGPSLSAGLVDGAWWPYTSTLTDELPLLLNALAARGYQVHRISYSLDGWPKVPRKLRLAGALVRLGGYRTQSPAVIHLTDSSGHAPLRLVVVPPGTEHDTAARALRLAVTSTALDAAGVLAAAAP